MGAAVSMEELFRMATERGAGPVNSAFEATRWNPDRPRVWSPEPDAAKDVSPSARPTGSWTTREG